MAESRLVPTRLFKSPASAGKALGDLQNLSEKAGELLTKTAQRNRRTREYTIHSPTTSHSSTTSMPDRDLRGISASERYMRHLRGISALRLMPFDEKGILIPGPEADLGDAPRVVEPDIDSHAVWVAAQDSQAA